MTILVKMDNLAEIQQISGKNSIDMAKEPLRKWSFGRTFTSVRGIRWNLTWIFTSLLRFGQNRHSLRASFCYLISTISQSHGNFRQIFLFFSRFAIFVNLSTLPRSTSDDVLPESPFSPLCAFLDLTGKIVRLGEVTGVCISLGRWLSVRLW